MKQVLSFLMVFGLCALGSVPALTQGPSADMMMGRMDADGDGRIIRKEWLANPAGFDRFDADKDGALTHAEIDAVFGGRKKPAVTSGQAPSNPVEWIDVHVHTNGGNRDRDFHSAVKGAVEAMEETSMTRAVLMPTPQSNAPTWTLEDFMIEGEKYPGRFVYLGGGGTLNPMIHADSPDGSVTPRLKKKFRHRAEEILARGAVGFGEMSGLHPSLTDGHPFESAPADHPLMLLLADIAAENDVVIDLHHDPIVEDLMMPERLAHPPNPPMLKENVRGLERLLAHNRRAKIVWAHVGSDPYGHRTADLSRRLLQNHPNLYMSIRMIKPKESIPGRFPLGQGFIKPHWQRLFQEFPDRFVLGGDQFFTGSQTRGPAAYFSEFAEKVRDNSATLLALLPPNVARKIGYENAARLYKFDR